MGKAIWDRQLINFPLSNVLYKHLLGLDVTLDDLQMMDTIFYKSLLWMRDHTITNIIFETFSIERREGQAQHMVTVDLSDSGRKRDVTESNKHEYIALMVKWRTYFAIRAQLDALLGGLSLLVPRQCLAIFTLEEFTLLLHGKPTFQVDE